MDKKYLAYWVPIFASQGGTHYQSLAVVPKLIELE